MSIIVTNEITVPAEHTETVAARFEQNAANLADVEGFLGFDLCQPTEPADDRWLVVTKWENEEAYTAWREGRAYAKSHSEKHQNGENHKPLSHDSVVRHYNVAFSTQD